MSTTLKVGDKAPDFELPDTELKTHSMKEFLGQKIILAFFVEPSHPCVQGKCVSFETHWLNYFPSGAKSSE